MVNKRSIATRYANALFSAALDAEVEQALWGDLQWFSKLLAGNEKLSKALKHPLPYKMKLSILSDTLAMHPVHNILNNLLTILAKNQRFVLFEEINRQYYSLMQKHKGFEALIIESSVAINKAMVDKISAVLESKINKKINVESRINKSLLGGMIFKHGSLILDCSMRTKMQKLKEVLMHAPL